MDYKKQIEGILQSLKKHGYDRATIEKEADYSPNYIDQQLSKGGNKRFVQALRKFRDQVLQKAMMLEDPESNLKEPGGDYNLGLLIAQQNKLILSMNRQSETANEILKRIANNVESKVERIDINLTDALGRVDGLRYDLYAGVQVSLESLARLEGKDPGVLLKQADNIKIGLLKAQSVQNKPVDSNK